MVAAIMLAIILMPQIMTVSGKLCLLLLLPSFQDKWQACFHVKWRSLEAARPRAMC